MSDNDLTIEQVNDGLITAGDVVMNLHKVYRDPVKPALDACIDILFKFDALGARTVKDIWRMLDRLEEVL